MNTIRIFLFIVFYTLIGIGLYWLGGILGVLWFFFFLHAYIGIFLGIGYIFQKGRRKKISPLSSRYTYMLSRFTLGIALFILMVGGFCVYQNYISPAQLPRITLSNGTQKVIFQTMSHIASPEFYTEVQKMIHTKKQEGYVLYFEGVRPGSEENSKKFAQALGIDIQNGLYEQLSLLYGVVHQENEDFLGLVNNKDYNIDLSIDEVMEIYEQKKGNSGIQKQSETEDMSPKIELLLDRLNQKELRLMQAYNQAILNFMMKNDWLRDLLVDNFTNTDLFDVILDDRNRHLVEEILRQKDEHIIILYGLMHYQGVLDELQKKDTKWKVEKLEYSQVIHSFSKPDRSIKNTK